jgi:hypothetical protein
LWRVRGSIRNDFDVPQTSQATTPQAKGSHG